MADDGAPFSATDVVTFPRGADDSSRSGATLSCCDTPFATCERVASPARAEAGAAVAPRALCSGGPTVAGAAALAPGAMDPSGARSAGAVTCRELAVDGAREARK